jgi:type I restriction enzyme S subunit
VPSNVKEQRKIAAVLQACDAEIELLKQKLAALKRQKQGLMQKLLAGRVRVKGF